jgi:1,5-anhydro-D-fructose reductase (1,5-anhydro-D-mannitol-forming)
MKEWSSSSNECDTEEDNAMALKIGVVGMGGMGSFHFRAYGDIKGAKVVAICDIEPKKLSGKGGVEINIGGGGKGPSLAGVRKYTDYKELLADAEVEVVDIALPTYLHAPVAIAALKAGKHVITEKPMAIDSGAAKRMAVAAKKAKRRLFVAHCIRFWPVYAKARDIVKSGKYGKMMSATFRRISGTPMWSWEGWLLDEKKSGMCALDMHIHDTDFILYCFGKPKSVSCVRGGSRKTCTDHIAASFDYGAGKLVTAEGAWFNGQGVPFGMSFTIAMEKATLMCGTDLKLVLHPVKGKPKELKVRAGDGYEHELRHFVDCIANGKKSPIVSPESAIESVKLVEYEVASAKKRRPVKVKL